MDIKVIKAKVQAGQFVVSAHADYEAADENIAFQEIYEAVRDGESLEYYPDTGRGESCLILGFVSGQAIM